MIRHALSASAALGVLTWASGPVTAADYDPTGLFTGRLSQPDAIIAPERGAGAEAASALNAPVAGRVFEAGEFDDVSALSIDVARVAGALGMEVDRSDSAFLGRVALRVVSDPDIGAPTVVTNPNDPNLRMLDRARADAPVGVYDIADDARGVTPRRGLRLDYSAPVSSRIAGVDVAVEPRANLVMGEQVSGAGGGAIVRFGRNLTAPREERSRWYAFVGADAQALTWAFSGVDHEPALRLEDKQMIGDYQAGVAVRVGQGDLAFGLIHREVKWNDVSRTEQFVGVTYALRR